MKRTREEYGRAIATLAINSIEAATLAPARFNIEFATDALESMRELRDSAFAFEEALVYLKEKAEMVLDAEGNTMMQFGVPLAMGCERAGIALASAAPAPAPPPSSQSSEKIMGADDSGPSAPPTLGF